MEKKQKKIESAESIDILGSPIYRNSWEMISGLKLQVTFKT